MRAMNTSTWSREGLNLRSNQRRTREDEKRDENRNGASLHDGEPKHLLLAVRWRLLVEESHGGFRLVEAITAEGLPRGNTHELRGAVS